MTSTWLTDIVSLLIIALIGTFALTLTHAPPWATVLLVISLWGSAVFR